LPGEERLLLDLGSLNFTHHKLMLGVYSHLVLMGVGYVSSLFFPFVPPDENLVYVARKAKVQKQ
jgi:SSS family solute:Na+ symporter